ncbi:hypothetical protein TNIN_14591 [Trichonephila inaurata madagascariensis]|uniref:Uncharacterized protein n=1 Tax=Trichonephila inaurata madagascariensis TaxID=2747483 RepID=A0A8X7BPW1_9ARAC|nr:hypothetical protein TNIN_14591 [Trichonephila inaurata madagascariensis]
MVETIIIKKVAGWKYCRSRSTTQPVLILLHHQQERSLSCFPPCSLNGLLSIFRKPPPSFLLWYGMRACTVECENFYVYCNCRGRFKGEEFSPDEEFYKAPHSGSLRIANSVVECSGKERFLS